MKNAFYFIFKAFFVLKIITFCFDFFGHVGKRLGKKATVNWKIYDDTNNYNTHIDQFAQLMEYISWEKNLIPKIMQKMRQED